MRSSFHVVRLAGGLNRRQRTARQVGLCARAGLQTSRQGQSARVIRSSAGIGPAKRPCFLREVAGVCSCNLSFVTLLPAMAMTSVASQRGSVRGQNGSCPVYTAHRLVPLTAHRAVCTGYVLRTHTHSPCWEQQSFHGQAVPALAGAFAPPVPGGCGARFTPARRHTSHAHPMYCCKVNRVRFTEPEFISVL
jgi:hypothetical protein